jgi:hypothetical protein
LRNAENIAAVIGLLALIAIDCARVLTGMKRKKRPIKYRIRQGGRARNDGPSWVDIVAKVENRRTPKISQKQIFS